MKEYTGWIIKNGIIVAAVFLGATLFSGLMAIPLLESNLSFRSYVVLLAGISWAAGETAYRKFTCIPMRVHLGPWWTTAAILIGGTYVAAIYTSDALAISVVVGLLSFLADIVHKVLKAVSRFNM